MTASAGSSERTHVKVVSASGWLTEIMQSEHLLHRVVQVAVTEFEVPGPQANELDLPVIEHALVLIFEHSPCLRWSFVVRSRRLCTCGRGLYLGCGNYRCVHRCVGECYCCTKSWKIGVKVSPIGINYSFDTTQLSAFIFILNLVESFFYVCLSDRKIGLECLLFFAFVGDIKVNSVYRSLLGTIAFMSTASFLFGQNGIVFTGQGPINRSMGGASTAAPLDSLGAIYWNPATISALNSEMAFGIEVLWPHSELSSSVPANVFGPGAPASNLSGTTNSDAGVFPLPSIGMVYHDKNSCNAYGLGIMTIGGLGVNYPSDPSNPILQAPPPQGLGVGPVYSQLGVIQIAPTVSRQITDRLSIGVSPTVCLASLSLDPNIVVPPDHPGNGPFVSYPRAGNGSYAAGGGVNAGMFYFLTEDWRLGASVKSTQWISDFRYNGINAQGQPIREKFAFDYPMIVSIGSSYTGMHRWLFASDFRYTDYANTDGFRDGSFGPDERVTGLGWRSTFGVALGAQRSVGRRMRARCGYTFNQSPLRDQTDPTSPLATINIASPAFIMHTIYTGASWQIADRLMLSCAYAHGFENSIGGIYRGPQVIVPGSTVSGSSSADTFLFGMTAYFGT